MARSAASLLSLFSYHMVLQVVGEVGRLGSWSFLLPVMERGSSVVQGDKDVWMRYVRLFSFSLFPFFFLIQWSTII